ncbi:TetR family transcriptional regulator [Mycolicibacterium celeriflavum]|uniref:TetR/AcrR family transcriptional regulator n=1 Tax=Mycolicibacterium celeriflavum TaxID=1249101 RepID=UPI0007FEAC58|nr:TetR/AcrR family transcriptional regulator [Mycolicibacterium celeriflavum]OBG21302.1 TetR family transcriptional regulator [Mycolicibacterium celeriflavum]
MASRGRPRTFDRTQALERAMEVFWQHGYDGASMTDLTTSMGINSPSLYGAFGSKEELFREAVAHYDQTLGATAAADLRDRPTAREAIAAVLRHHAHVFCDPDKPRGCMIVLAATTCTDRTRSVHEHLAQWRIATEDAFRARVERGIADGDVPAGADAATIAAFYNTVNHGMAIQARDGADRTKLSAIAEAAIAAWDSLVLAQ